MLGSMVDPEDKPPYAVEPEDGRFRVVDGEGNTILVCGDAASAEQYAVLMNQAFRRGFSAGYREARG